MLDPRIYRTGLVAVALAVVVFAFSLYDQRGALSTTLAPDAFNGENAYATMSKLAASYPHRGPGSPADYAIAADVVHQLRRYGFLVSRDFFAARTAAGTRRLENVVGVRPGLGAGRVVVVAHRDALTSPAAADASGTAVLLELARVLAGETQHRTIVLASTSGSSGASGAARLAATLGRAVDAVIVLGDLAGRRVRQPIVVPWSNAQNLAPALLRNTVAGALATQAGLPPGALGLGDQFAHLAFPMAATEQGPFGAHGLPAVLLSLSGERPAGADEPTSPTQITALGRTTLQTITALDAGATMPAPSAYLLYDGKSIPRWALRLLVLALILPVLGTAIDGAARARRRGHSLLRWLVWAMSAAMPFVLGLLVVLVSSTIGLIAAAPPGPLAAGAVPLQGKAIAVLVLVGCAMAAGFALFRPLMIRVALPRRRGSATDRAAAPDPYGEGAGAAMLLLLCASVAAIWVTNPFAAALLIPALHLWMWIAEPTVQPRGWTALLLLAGGLALPVLTAVYYALTLGLDPAGLAWNGALALAGGDIGLLTALEWSAVVGCAVSTALIAVSAVRQARPEERPVTVRGPVTYAGPGSLGGTESALRR
jgi:hypothetical protein